MLGSTAGPQRVTQLKLPNVRTQEVASMPPPRAETVCESSSTNPTPVTMNAVLRDIDLSVGRHEWSSEHQQGRCQRGACHLRTTCGRLIPQWGETAFARSMKPANR